MMFNSSIAGYLRVNLAVPLLATLAVMTIRRVDRESTLQADQPQPEMLRTAA
jgi:hypothetical protein